MTIEELEQRFRLLSDPTLRYQYIIQLGRKLPPLPDEEHSDENLVRGCMSRVWLVSRADENDPSRIVLDGDSDSVIVKGLFAILRLVYSGKTSEEILSIDLRDVFARLRLADHLSPNRRNGFFSMVETIRETARTNVPA